MIKAGIVGATGYAGAELVRLLHGHPQAEVTAISSVSFLGMELSDVYPAYRGLCDLVCDTQEAVVEQCDVIFAALPHGLSQELAQQCMDAGKVFVDLGADFRLKDEDTYEKWYSGTFLNPALHAEAVYGLPEFFRKDIVGKRLIANPGCYTTAVPMALAPAVTAGVCSSKSIVADCKSGATGAGRKPTQTTHFPELNEGFSAYKVANHRHCPEMEQTLTALAGEQATVTFVPHLLPINRGILATCYAELTKEITLEELHQLYTAFYKDEPFVRVLSLGKCANVNAVQYSNFVDISVHMDSHTGKLIAISAIDNMVKGAAGQAVQNMNLIFGLEETTGLLLMPPAF